MFAVFGWLARGVEDIGCGGMSAGGVVDGWWKGLSQLARVGSWKVFERGGGVGCVVSGCGRGCEAVDTGMPGSWGQVELVGMSP